VGAGAVAVIAALALTACGGSGSDDSGDVVLGLVEDTSGPGAAYSKITAGSVRAAVDEINAKGGVLGGRKLRIEAGNDGSDPSKSPTVTRKIIGKGAVAVLFPTGSGAILANKSVMQQSKVVGIAPTSATAQLATPPDNDYFYIQVPSTEHQSQAFVGAFQAAGIKKLAIFSDDTPTIASYNKVFVPAFEKAGIEIVRQEHASVKATDVTAQVSRIRDAEPDAVLATSVGGQLEVLFHNTAQPMLGDKVKRFSLASIGNQPALWKLAKPGALDGLVYTSHVAPDNPRTKELRAALEAKNGPDFVMTDYDADAFNAVYLVKNAIEKAGSADPAKIHEAMNQTTKFPSYFGQANFTVSFNATKHDGADGPCGLVFAEFEDNKPAGKWDGYQPECK
jgi:branched-chain amino acid transport system substrate-binding protein